MTANETTLPQLRDLRAEIEQLETRRDQTNTARMEDAKAALAAGALMREVTAATGISRAGLHKAGVTVSETPRPGRHVRRPDTPNDSRDRAQALTRAAARRDELDELDPILKTSKARRRGLALDAVRLNVSSNEICDAAGITTEWLRRVARANDL